MEELEAYIYFFQEEDDHVVLANSRGEANTMIKTIPWFEEEPSGVIEKPLNKGVLL